LAVFKFVTKRKKRSGEPLFFQNKINLKPNCVCVFLSYAHSLKMFQKFYAFYFFKIEIYVLLSIITGINITVEPFLSLLKWY